MCEEELVKEYYISQESSMVREVIAMWCKMNNLNIDKLTKEYPEWQI